jgi:malonyl-CoA/methylmalonyl-CoA synthetase
LALYGTSETGSISVKRTGGKDAFSDLLEGVKIRLEANGEVALNSPGLFPGYYHSPEITRQNMTADGWWLTGDLGEIKDGKLALKGRSNERISKSGYSIYPQEIEWALSQSPEVKEVRVVGVSSAASVNDRIVAFYSGTATGEGLTDYSKTNLPRSWRPDQFVKLKELPKNRTGKVIINKLREMAEKSV